MPMHMSVHPHTRMQPHEKDTAHKQLSPASQSSQIVFVQTAQSVDVGKKFPLPVPVFVAYEIGGCSEAFMLRAHMCTWSHAV